MLETDREGETFWKVNSRLALDLDFTDNIICQVLCSVYFLYPAEVTLLICQTIATLNNKMVVANADNSIPAKL